MQLPFLSARRRKARVGVSATAEGVALAVIDRAASRGRLAVCRHRQASERDLAHELTALVGSTDIVKLPASAVIESGAYQLLLVERPDVPEQEIASAVRWRIRDLLSFPAEEAVIDVFDIPPPRRAQNRMLYAVAAQSAAIRAHADAMTAAGMNLDALDIPELCLRNVATALPEDAHGLALLHFERDYGVLTVTRKGVLYLIRRIETGRPAVFSATDMNVNALAADVALELQRSLDYFESHYDQRPIGKLVLDPGTPESFVGALGDQVGVAVSTLDLRTMLELDAGVSPEDQARCLLSIGAALRDDAHALEVAA